MKLNGGLGNQMFQYAVAYALAEKNADYIKLDLSGFAESQKQTYREFGLGSFNLSFSSVASQYEVNKFKYEHGIFSILLKFIKRNIFKKYYEDWHPEVLDWRGDFYLDGYFQSENYFLDIADKIKSEFSLQPVYQEQLDNWSSQLKGSVTVSIHVRRGDYVSDPIASRIHNICDVNYFNNALTYLRNKIGRFTLVVFSDDIIWVKNNLNFTEDVFYVTGQADVFEVALNPSQEVALMARCSHHIISNSSFSWWGAFLNRSNNKIVCAPSLWSKSKIHTHPNIVPDSWIKIPVD